MLEAIGNKRKQTVNGEDWYYDPIFGDYVSGPYHVGHNFGEEFARIRDKAEQAGLTQAEFNDLCNNPKLYFMQNKGLNESHLGEKKPGLTPEQQEKNLKRYWELARQIVEEKNKEYNQSP